MKGKPSQYKKNYLFKVIAFRYDLIWPQIPMDMQLQSNQKYTVYLFNLFVLCKIDFFL